MRKRNHESVSYQAYVRVWVLGSLFGALQDAVQLRSITRETWIEERSIPDWTDYVRHGIPCGRPELER